MVGVGSKPHEGTLFGSSAPVRPRQGRQPEASLAWSFRSRRATVATKRRQRVSRRCGISPEIRVIERPTPSGGWKATSLDAET